ncbi:MAG: NADH-ubiquinone/plastoquinone oxidoreductase subunit 6 [Desulfobacca sp. RBG_16_60_12]|nr:MAG: NADH-ubiquinone/plastoquinone oxidoreductase subunit 6 [Desulfobacca sp. RBG_16_60_12]
MSIYAVMFYVLGAVIVAATALAITRPNVMHAIVCLALSFVATALLFYLLGAPFLAVLEVVIYAGAIMVLFLFIVMMLETKPDEKILGPSRRQWLPVLALGGVCLIVMVVFLLLAAGGPGPLPLVTAAPLAFGRFLFQKYWLAVEIASFLLFVALVGALYLGRGDGTTGG